MSVLPSVRPHGTTRLLRDGCSWNLIFEDCSNICWENSGFYQNITKITGTLHEDLCTFTIISLSFLLRMRNTLEWVCGKKQNTLCIFHNCFQKVWPFVRRCKNRKICCCISTATMFTRTRHDATLYGHWLCCLVYQHTIFFSLMARQPPVGQDFFIVEASRSHSVRHTTLGRTPRDEWWDWRRDLYLTAHNNHKKHLSMPQARFEPAVPAASGCRPTP
jgi:hypothetical protein